jgi:hypothetical protein
MEYIVLGKDGNEYGPVDTETLKKWVEHGRVQKDSQIRNAMVRKWNDAGTMDFLQDSFAAQDVVVEEESSSGVLGALGFGKSKKSEPERPQEKGTAFKYKHVPDPAPPVIRLMSGLTDVLVLGAFAGVLFLFMNISAGTLSLGEFATGWEDDLVKAGETVADPYGEVPEDQSEKGVGDDAEKESKKKSEEKLDGASKEKASEGSSDGEDAAGDAEKEKPKVQLPPAWQTVTKDKIERLNSLFPKFFTLFALGAWIYLGIGLGVFAQTVGMWYWGLIIVKTPNDEALPARAFAFAVAMLLIGFLSPLVTLFSPRSFHEYLTGTSLIRISGKPR